jgi:EAL domain-containing protein (putative c-di-GMP-specific phosphodiesterase class I)
MEAGADECLSKPLCMERVQEIIKTIIAMAQNLNVKTVAEGVETKA